MAEQARPPGLQDDPAVEHVFVAVIIVVHQLGDLVVARFGVIVGHAKLARPRARSARATSLKCSEDDHRVHVVLRHRALKGAHRVRSRGMIVVGKESILRPPIPPWALISSAASCAALVMEPPATDDSSPMTPRS